LSKPQGKPKVNRKIVYLIVASVLVYAVVLFTEPDAPAGTTRKKTTTVKTKASAGLFTEVDYKVTADDFAPVNEPVRNTFRPLVVRTTESPAVATPGYESGIPAFLADGDGNWRYTGSAVVDGVPNALLENRSTGDGVFLRPGERWRRATVVSVTSETVVLRGPDGQLWTVRIEGDEEGEGVGGLAPARVIPPLSGPIGGMTLRSIPDVRGQGSAFAESDEVED
jgi:hypothetical protein